MAPDPEGSAAQPIYCGATCSIGVEGFFCQLELGHEHEHEANVDITVDSRDTPIIVWWGDDGHAFVGSDKAVNTGRIG